jgi:hypothetical protein
VTLDIPMAPPLPNRLRGVHWSVKAKARREWQNAVDLALLEAGWRRAQGPLDHPTVTLTRISAAAPDPDNVMAGWKPLIDALVVAGVMIDDSADAYTLVSRWEKGPKKSPTCRVEIVDGL